MKQQARNSCRLAVFAALLIGTGLYLAQSGAVARAQAVQPTGQSNPATRNPQPQTAQNLGAPRTTLQDNIGPQLSGGALNQLSARPLTISVPKPPALSVAQPFPGSAPDRTAASQAAPKANKFLLPAAGLLLSLVLFLATYFVREKPAQPTAES